MKISRRIVGLILLFVYLSSCGSPTSATQVSSPAQVETLVPTGTPAKTSLPGAEITATVPEPSMATSEPAITLATCQLDPVAQPTWPTEIPGPNQLDPEANLHMTGSPQQINLDTYRLEVTGLVDHPLSLTYDEIRCMRKITDNPELVCPGVFTDYARWTGVPIMDVLALAGVQAGATEVTLVSADGYEMRLPLETARAEKNFFAYDVNGKTLPILHGFPLRAVFPDMWGSYWLKWLIKIKIS